MKYLPWKILGAALILGIIFDALLYNTDSIGINLLLMQLAFLAAAGFFAWHLKRKLNARTIIAASFATAFSAVFALWTSDISLTLAGFGFFIANLLFVLYLFGHHGKTHHPFEFIADGVQHLITATVSRLSVLGHLKLPGRSEKRSAILTGVLISIPILVIFAALFIGSDLLLQNQTGDILDWMQDNIGDDFLVHVIIIGFFTLSFVGIFAAAFWRKIESFTQRMTRTVFNTESAIILGSSATLFLFFLIVQGVYLFGGQAAWDGIEGITYSEYAVNGFTELAVIAFLVIFMILTLRFFHGEKSKGHIITLETILLGETVLVIASAFIRMQLYTQMYGFTPARLFGFWFFIITGIVLILFAINIINKREQYRLIQCSLIAIGAAILIFAAIRPDALSVKLNAKLDLDETAFQKMQLYIDLSLEATSLVHAAIQDDKAFSKYKGSTSTVNCEKVNKLISSNLTSQKEEDFGTELVINNYYHRALDQIDRHNDWRTWNYSAQKAKQVLEGLVPSDECGVIELD